MLESDLQPATAPSTIFLKDYRQPDFLIPTTDLDFQLGETHTRVTATLQVQRNGAHQRSLVLDGEKMDLISLKVDGKRVDEGAYTLADESLTIDAVPDSFALEIVTQLQPHLNTELSGLYQSSGNFCTQCEAEGFRRITFFLDRPDVLSVYTVSLTADKKDCPVLLSNGNRDSSGETSDGRHWAKWHDPHPKPSYLFALVAGDLEHINGNFVTASGMSVELNIYTQVHNIDKCAHAMDSLIESMRWDEKVYGREYDLDIYNVVAVDDFNMGAMENKGLNVFNSKYVLADQASATDADYEGIESVIGHEYFHNWSGNRVTCRDWFQLSLKEGLTVFRDQEFSADMGSRAVKRIRDVQVLRTHQFKEDSGPMAHPVRPDSYQEINNFYTVTIYEKGAEVIRMMHHLVGEQGFRKATDLYFDRFDGCAVTTEDFVQCMEQANDCDLSLFRNWYTQAGTPVVTVKQEYDSGSKILRLQVDQECPPTPNQNNKQPFHIPVSFALISPEGVISDEQTLIVDQQTQTFEFHAEQPPVVSFLRDFSAPVKLVFRQTEAELAHLVKYDNNGFVRFEAIQRMALNLLLPAIKTGEFDDTGLMVLVDTLRYLLDNPPADQAMLAELLTLPSESYLADSIGQNVDPLQVSLKRNHLMQTLSLALESSLLAHYHRCEPTKEFSLSSKAMARRALRNKTLAWLMYIGSEEVITLGVTQFANATTMTEQQAALGSLVMQGGDHASKAVKDFYEQWQKDPLVLDKWFAIQASAPGRETVKRVRTLLEHPAFSIRNPNKVRSLLGAFAANLSGFHSPGGHELLASQIIELNDINPQVAARIVSAFNTWRLFKVDVQNSMREQLERIYAIPNLSKDISEIVGKALA